MFHSSGLFIILHLSFYYLLTLFWQISENRLWHFWNTFVKGDTFVTHLWKIVTLLWRFCNLCNFIIFLLSFNYLATLLWHICKNFGTSIQSEYRLFFIQSHLLIHISFSQIIFILVVSLSITCSTPTQPYPTTRSCPPIVSRAAWGARSPRSAWTLREPVRKHFLKEDL